MNTVGRAHFLNFLSVLTSHVYVGYRMSVLFVIFLV